MEPTCLHLPRARAPEMPRPSLPSCRRRTAPRTAWRCAWSTASRTPPTRSRKRICAPGRACRDCAILSRFIKSCLIKWAGREVVQRLPAVSGKANSCVERSNRCLENLRCNARARLVVGIIADEAASKAAVGFPADLAAKKVAINIVGVVKLSAGCIDHPDRAVTLAVVSVSVSRWSTVPFPQVARLLHNNEYRKVACSE